VSSANNIDWLLLYTPVSKLYETLDFLNLDSIYELQLAIFMHKVNHLKLPEIFYESFTKIETVHSHNTKRKQSFEYFLPRVNKKISQNLLAFRGAKSWALINNDLKILSLFIFKRKMKNIFLSKHFQ